MNRAAPPTQISRQRAIVIYLLVTLFLFFEMLVQVSPSIMSSQLMAALNIGSFGLGIMSGCYFYTYAAMQLPSGLLFDRFNPRFIIACSILICSIGIVLFAAANSIVTGIIARLFMGVGSAFAFVSVLVVTADLFEAKYFATMTGITQMLAALGAMTGQMPVSLLVTSLGWRQTLLVLAAVGFVLFILVLFLLRYKVNKPSETEALHHAKITASLKTILSNRQTWFVALYACLLWAPMSGFASLWGVRFLQTVDNLSEHTAALLCSFMWLGLAVASPFLGFVSTAIRNRVKPLYFSALVGVFAFGLINYFTLPAPLLAFLLLFSGAACSGQALSFTVVKENNHYRHRATAIAFNNMAVVISGALFQPLIGKLLALQAGPTALSFSSHHFQTALAVVFFAYLAAFLTAFFLIRERGGK